MKYALFVTAVAALGLTLLTPNLPAHADSQSDYDSAYGSGPYEGHPGYSFDGKILKVDADRDRMTIVSEADHLYRVDTYNCEITLSRNHEGDASDLEPGMHVHVVGVLLGRNLVEADRMRLLPRIEEAAYTPPAPEPVHSDPVPVAPVVSDSPAFLIDGVVTRVDADSDHLVLLTDDDHRYTIDSHDSDIILRNMEHTGATSDLSRGTRVHVIGTLLSSGVVAADRIRVLAPSADAVQPLAVSAPVQAPVESLDSYTGILIDARGLPGIMRSPSPAIYGPDSDHSLLYPDRSHVPTPDEVQEESIVRYYRTEDAARDGVGGAHPLIIPAEAVVGPAHDGVTLSPENAALFQELDKRLHYSRTWKVGFLIPADQ